MIGIINGRQRMRQCPRNQDINLPKVRVVVNVEEGRTTKIK